MLDWCCYDIYEDGEHIGTILMHPRYLFELQVQMPFAGEDDLSSPLPILLVPRLTWFEQGRS